MAAVCVETARAYVVVEEEEEKGVCNALSGIGDCAGKETSDAIARVDLFGSVEDAIVGVLR